jgi:sulfofructose kinase
MNAYDLVGIGKCTLDFLGIVDELPKLDSGSHLHDFTMQGGGLVATALVAASRLGMRCAIVDTIGDDWIGRCIVEGLESEGVSTEFLTIVPGGTSMRAIVLVHRETGKRSLMCNGGNLTQETLPQGAEQAIRNAWGLHLQDSAGLALDTARIAHDSGTIVSADINAQPGDAPEFFELADVVIAPEDWIDGVSTDARVALLENALMAGVGTIAVTLGDKGVIGMSEETGDEVITIPAFDVDVVDTTGAGDTFHGAYLVALHEGWDFPSRLRYAAAVSAMKCTRLGGREGIPHRHELTQFLAEHSVELTGKSEC